jgi:hypothetical protein
MFKTFRTGTGMNSSTTARAGNLKTSLTKTSKTNPMNNTARVNLSQRLNS